MSQPSTLMTDIEQMRARTERNRRQQEELDAELKSLELAEKGQEGGEIGKEAVEPEVEEMDGSDGSAGSVELSEEGSSDDTAGSTHTAVPHVLESISIPVVPDRSKYKTLAELCRHRDHRGQGRRRNQRGKGKKRDQRGHGNKRRRSTPNDDDDEDGSILILQTPPCVNCLNAQVGCYVPPPQNGTRQKRSCTYCKSIKKKCVLQPQPKITDDQIRHALWKIARMIREEEKELSRLSGLVNNIVETLEICRNRLREIKEELRALRKDLAILNAALKTALELDSDEE